MIGCHLIHFHSQESFPIFQPLTFLLFLAR